MQQFVSTLLECERLVVDSFLERRRTDSFIACLALAEKEFVCLVNAFDNVLNRLAAELIPVGVLVQLLQLRQVFLELVSTQVFTKSHVIPLMKGNAVIVHFGGNVDLAMKMAISFVAVQLELICLHLLDTYQWHAECVRQSLYPLFSRLSLAP